MTELVSLNFDKVNLTFKKTNKKTTTHELNVIKNPTIANFIAPKNQKVKKSRQKVKVKVLITCTVYFSKIPNILKLYWTEN